MIGGLRRYTMSLHQRRLVRGPRWSLVLLVLAALAACLLQPVEAKNQRATNGISTTQPTKNCDNCSTQIVLTTERPSVTSQLPTNPKTSNQKTASSARPMGIITKTSDAIYRALSGVFSYDDEPSTTFGANRLAPLMSSTSSELISTDAPEPTTLAGAMTSRRPKKKKTTKSSSTSTLSVETTERGTELPATTLDDGQSEGPQNDVAINQNATTRNLNKLIELSQQMNSLVNNLGLIGNFRNRTLRLAPEIELSDFKLDSGQLTLAPNQQLATSEDVHLLCKLLQRHLISQNTSSSGLRPSDSDQSGADRPSGGAKQGDQAITPAGSSVGVASKGPISGNNSAQLGPNRDPPTVRPPSDELIVSELSQLGVPHESHLLESVLNSEVGAANRTRAERLLSGLFGKALDASRSRVPTEGAGERDYDSEPELVAPRWGQLQLQSYARYCRTFTLANQSQAQHLHLVYWLAERRLGSANWRLLGPREAVALLDDMDHSELSRQLSAMRFSPVGPLVAAFNKSRWQTEQLINHQDEREPARAIDDSLEEVHEPSSRLTSLWSRFLGAPFTDHLYLYMIMLVLVLLVLALCFAMPMLCCSRSRRPESLSLGPDERLRPAGRARPVPVQVEGPRTMEESQQDNKLLGADAIWRKLSSSTSTLVHDESRELRADGLLEPVILDANNGLSRFGSKPVGGQFQWYTFEDRMERVSRTMDRKLAPQVEATAGEGSQLVEPVRFEGRQESRNSSTLTKSELVMLKEKMVPISLSGRSDRVGGDASEQTGSKRSKVSETGKQAPESFRAACSAGRRTELPTKSRRQVEAIRKELDRLEEADLAARKASEITYRRYEI